MDDRYLYAGLIRLHLLHHAVKEPIYGLAMIEELGRHGYKVSAGTNGEPSSEAPSTSLGIICPCQ